MAGKEGAKGGKAAEAVSYQDVAIELSAALNPTSPGGIVDTSSTRALVESAVCSVLGCSKETMPAAEASLLQHGLDSLKTVRVLGLVRAALSDAQLPDLARFLQSPMIASWTDLVDSAIDGTAGAGGASKAAGGLPLNLQHVVRGSDPNAIPMVFCHPMSGLTGAWSKFVKEFGGERDIYLIEHPCELPAAEPARPPPDPPGLAHTAFLTFASQAPRALGCTARRNRVD